MSRSDFLAWALPAYAEWMQANLGLTPSLDRIKPAGHYEIGNLRILERGENSRLATGNLNVHAPEGMAWCGGQCKRYLPQSAFQRMQRAFNGLQKRCRECQNAAVRQTSATKRRAAAQPTQA